MNSQNTTASTAKSHVSQTSASTAQQPQVQQRRQQQVQPHRSPPGFQRGPASAPVPLYSFDYPHLMTSPPSSQYTPPDGRAATNDAVARFLRGNPDTVLVAPGTATPFAYCQY